MSCPREAFGRTDQVIDMRETPDYFAVIDASLLSKVSSYSTSLPKHFEKVRPDFL